MTRDELVTTLAGRLDAPIHSTRVFLHAYFDVAKSMLRNGESVEIGNLGVWEPEVSESGELVAVRYRQPVESTNGTGVWNHGQRYIIPSRELRLHRDAALEMVDVAAIVSEVTAHARKPHTRSLETTPDLRPIHLDTPLPHQDESESPLPVDWEQDPSLAELLDEIEAEDERAVEFIPEAHDDGEELAEHTAADIEILDKPTFEADSAEYSIDVPLGDDAPRSERSASEIISAQEMRAEQPRVEAMERRLEIGVAHQREHEDFEDDASFYRNRDQLYNPPEQPGNKRLALVAIVLTAILIAIMLYYAFTDDPVHELPGVDAPTGALLFSHVNQS